MPSECQFLLFTYTPRFHPSHGEPYAPSVLPECSVCFFEVAWLLALTHRGLLSIFISLAPSCCSCLRRCFLL